MFKRFLALFVVAAAAPAAILLYSQGGLLSGSSDEPSLSSLTLDSEEVDIEVLFKRAEKWIKDLDVLDAALSNEDRQQINLKNPDDTQYLTEHKFRQLLEQSGITEAPKAVKPAAPKTPRPAATRSAPQAIAVEKYYVFSI